MPPHVQPKSLQDIALANVTCLVIDLCSGIERGFGSYDTASCQQVVEEFQNYLLPKVAPLLDDICNSLCDNSRSKLVDTRIFYATVVNPRTRVLTLQQYFSIWMDLPIEKNWFSGGFFANLLRNANNITKLIICKELISEHAFVVIEECCGRNLQELSITPPLPKISVCVLENLSKCHQLQRVKVTSYPFATKDEILGALLFFFKSTPHLEFFECNNLANVLLAAQEDFPPTNLTRITDLNVTLQSILKVIELCPHVKDLHICLSQSATDDCLPVLGALENSSLQLCRLALYNFAFVPQLESLLKAKGFLLRHLEIGNQRITCRDVCVVGKTCPNLETLLFEVVHPCTCSSQLVEETACSQVKIFTKLESLSYGYLVLNSCGQRVLSLILSNVDQIKDIKVLCHSEIPNHDVLMEILNTNSLTSLTELSLIVNGTGIITRRSMECLINQCDKLKKLYVFSNFERGLHYSIQELFGKILDENLDLKLHIFERK